MVAAEIQADLLILMSDVDGIYNKPPWEDGAKLMSTYTNNDKDQIQFGKKSKVSPSNHTSETDILVASTRFRLVTTRQISSNLSASLYLPLFVLYSLRWAPAAWTRRSARLRGPWIGA